MGRVSDDPVTHVVSFRVNGEEKAFLEALARKAGLNISSLLRKYFILLENQEMGSR